MTKIAAEYQGYQRSLLMKRLAALAHGEGYQGQTSSATYSEIRTRIEALSLPPNSRILDAGCGNGTFTLSLARDFPFFFKGVDLGEELIKEANGLALQYDLSSKCRFSVGDFAELSIYSADIFDAIICIGSLYWGQPLSTILTIWHQITRPKGQLILFLNLAYTSLSPAEKEAVGETQFFSPLALEYELSQHGWALCDWSDVTITYIEWLKRWCKGMEKLFPDLCLEMGKSKADQLLHRFKTYLKLAQKQAVRRIILRAEHVQ